MKYTFRFENVDCGHCAAKIETLLNNDSRIESCQLNFILKKIEITTKKKEETEEMRAYIEQKAKSLEKDILVFPFEEAKPQETHEHSHEHGTDKFLWLRLGVSLVLLLIGSITDSPWLLIGAYAVVGYDVLLEALTNIFKGKIFDENFLMALATLAAFAIKEYPEAVAVMIFYQIGEYFQHRAVAYSRRAIADLMDIRPTFARVLREEKLEVDPSLVKVGEKIEVRAGEKIPLDGIVLEGTSTLDKAMLTGESVLEFAGVGTQVLSGSINKEGVLIIEVQKVYGESTVSKILALIEEAGNKKSVAENFITKFARWYTPIVVLLAVLVAIVPSLFTGNWSHWIYTSIVFLMISCPCALVISIPLGFFGGIGVASKKGILIKGSNYLEKLNMIDTLVLDKTGTITEGKFEVSQLYPAAGWSEEALLNYCVPLERYSTHPIAKCITTYGKNVAETAVEDYQELAGYGIGAYIHNKQVFVGNAKLLQDKKIAFEIPDVYGSIVFVAVDGQYAGCIAVADRMKVDTPTALSDLRHLGIQEVIMLTGDKKETAAYIAKEAGVDTYFAELLPQEKVEKVEMLLNQGKHVAFVGDGINDAPVLARADIGISMGGVGSDAAIEASDMVLMTDELSLIVTAKKIAAYTKKIVTQNIVLALGVKFLVMILGILGIASMWLAVFADIGVSLIAILNAMRILFKKSH